MQFSDLNRDDVFRFIGGNIVHIANGDGTYDDMETANGSVIVYRVEIDGHPLRSLRALASEAIVIQDACNLSGVVLSFSRALPQLRRNLELFNQPCGTDDIAKHPISVLYADKIHSLTGCGYLFSSAYEKCQKIANGALDDSR